MDRIVSLPQPFAFNILFILSIPVMSCLYGRNFFGFFSFSGRYVSST